MTTKTIHLIAAARPNFMKVAPLYHALNQADGLHPVLVHTGQHYDLNMSDVFFQDLKLPEPDIHGHRPGSAHAHGQRDDAGIGIRGQDQIPGLGCYR